MFFPTDGGDGELRTYVYPFELRSNRRETSARRVLKTLQLWIFRHRKFVFREMFGFGTLLDFRILPEFMNNGLMILAPGAFIILGLIIWAQRTITGFIEE